jgi:hypothetical protein
MRAVLTIFMGSLILAAPAGAKSPEEKLAGLIEGRVAGEPVDCIQLRDVNSTRIIKGEAIVYEVGRTLYVNYPTSGKDQMDSWDTLVTRTFTDRLCSSDVVELKEQPSGMLSGLVFLGEFVPYRKAD